MGGRFRGPPSYDFGLFKNSILMSAVAEHLADCVKTRSPLAATKGRFIRGPHGKGKFKTAPDGAMRVLVAVTARSFHMVCLSYARFRGGRVCPRMTPARGGIRTASPCVSPTRRGECLFKVVSERVEINPHTARPLKIGLGLSTLEGTMAGVTPRWHDLKRMAQHAEAVGFELGLGARPFDIRSR